MPIAASQSRTSSSSQTGKARRFFGFSPGVVFIDFLALLFTDNNPLSVVVRALNFAVFVADDECRVLISANPLSIRNSVLFRIKMS